MKSAGWVKVVCGACAMTLAMSAQAIGIGASIGSALGQRPALHMLEGAISCIKVDQQFSAAEQFLAAKGWHAKDSSPVALDIPVQVYGQRAFKVSIYRDGGQAHFVGIVTDIPLVNFAKLARLSPDANRQSYSRLATVDYSGHKTQGLLTAEPIAQRLIRVTCTVDAEGSGG